MIIGSHNSWSYLPTKKWWMKPFAFIARCQDKIILEQYCRYNVRCFDLRVRFSKHGQLIIAHGFAEYNINEEHLFDQLKMLNDFGDVVIRVIHEVRTKKQHSEKRIQSFRTFCEYIVKQYPNIDFWCGRNLYNWGIDYEFQYKPSCEEKYASVCSPKLIDDWYPKQFAKYNNKKIIKRGTNKDILLIDFVNIK